MGTILTYVAPKINFHYFLPRNPHQLTTRTKLFTRIARFPAKTRHLSELFEKSATTRPGKSSPSNGGFLTIKHSHPSQFRPLGRNVLNRRGQIRSPQGVRKRASAISKVDRGCFGCEEGTANSARCVSGFRSQISNLFRRSIVRRLERYGSELAGTSRYWGHKIWYTSVESCCPQGRRPSFKNENTRAICNKKSATLFFIFRTPFTFSSHLFFRGASSWGEFFPNFSQETTKKKEIRKIFRKFQSRWADLERGCKDDDRMEKFLAQEVRQKSDISERRSKGLLFATSPTVSLCDLSGVILHRK